MHLSVVVFVGSHLRPEEARGKRVLEVGARDVNGSVRPVVENAFAPAEYVGVDLEAGPGVDAVAPAEELAGRFGEERFDVVLALELMEHVRDWRAVVSNLKRVTAPEGVILLTTRSPGFKYHGYPHDFWRYEPADMARVFADCDLLANESDPQDPGVFVKARRPAAFAEADLADVQLVSMVTGRREREVEEAHFRSPHYRKLMAKLWRRDLRKRVRTRRKALAAALLGRGPDAAEG